MLFWPFFKFCRYFGHFFFWVLGVFWLLLGFGGILVIFWVSWVFWSFYFLKLVILSDILGKITDP